MTHFRISTFVAACALGVCTFPAAVAAYGEGGYYSQSYYQSTYYSQSYYQSSYVTTFTSNVAATQDFSVFGSISKGSGTFVIDHPLDPKNMLLFHSFVESPDVKNLYDGIAKLDVRGEATISLPGYFEALNRDFRYLLRPIGAPMPNLHVKDGVKDNQFTVAGGVADGKISWQVTGIRRDPYIEANPIEVEVRKGPEEIVMPGEYLHDAAYPSRLPSLRNILSKLHAFFIK